MVEQLSFDLVAKRLITNQIVLTIEYDIENLTNNAIKTEYKGEIEVDRYGRKIPKHAHGTENLNHRTSSYKLMEEAVVKLYRRIINEKLLVRKIYVVANNVVSEEIKEEKNKFEQMNLFTHYEANEEKQEKERKKEEAEKRMQQAILSLKQKYGKNAVIKGMNLQKDGTMIQRNGEIGGHKA